MDKLNIFFEKKTQHILKVYNRKTNNGFIVIKDLDSLSKLSGV